MKKSKLSFPKLAEALKLHDKHVETITRKLWDALTDDEQLATVQHLEKVALIALQVAFHEDTKNINSLDHCRLVGIDRLRILATMTPSPAKTL